MSGHGDGVRIRLNLSDFEPCASKQLRLTYLSYDRFATVRDLKDLVTVFNESPFSEEKIFAKFISRGELFKGGLVGNLRS
jgi:hypothetical protein